MRGYNSLYYRQRRRKRLLLTALLIIFIVVVVGFLICGSRNGETVRKENESGFPGKRSEGSSGIGSGKISEGDKGVKGSQKEIPERIKKKGSSGTGSHGKRKRVKRKTPYRKPAALKKIEKVKPEKRLPPKPPTLEIIGEDGKVLMKKK